MSSNQEQFNQGSPEQPRGFLKYLEEHKALPPLDHVAFEKLQEAMTQEQILQTYRLIDDIGDFKNENRQKVLDTWYPHPKELYHTSRSGMIELFEPRKETYRHEDDPPQVFATPSREVATMFFVNENYISSSSYDNERTWTVVIGDKEDFRKKDTGGYIYQLPPENFTTNPNYGLGLFEWQSTEKIAPVSKKHYPSGIDAMLEHGIKIYFMSPDEYDKFLNAENQKEILDRREPYKKENH